MVVVNLFPKDVDNKENYKTQKKHIKLLSMVDL